MLYFVATDGVNARELWVSDGTEAGTRMTKNIAPGQSRSSNVAYITPYNNQVFFQADDGTTGIELWKSDGTEAGTVVVINLAPEPSGSPVKPTPTPAPVRSMKSDATTLYMLSIMLLVALCGLWLLQ